MRVSWQYFYTKMATSGLFLGDRDEIEVIPYDRNAIEPVSGSCRAACGAVAPIPEAFKVNDRSIVATQANIINRDFSTIKHW